MKKDGTVLAMDGWMDRNVATLICFSHLLDEV